MSLSGKEISQGVPSTLYDEQYFLSVCEGYQEFISTEGENLSRRLAAALAVAGIAPGMRVLDVGCGRGEVLRHVAQMQAQALGLDYAAAAVRLSRQIVDRTGEKGIGIYQADALRLPFANASFDRILMFDIVEHLYPAQLDQALSESARILKPGGRIAVHTAPNIWYDRYAYPLVRMVRILMGQGAAYPKNPRALIPANLHVHVNEQSIFSLGANLRRAGFRNVRVWLSSPPQHRHENLVFQGMRRLLFDCPPFRWFFEREVFAVGEK